jgi:hypothetical protein
MAWLTDFQRGYRMARGVEQYLQARAQARAEFRRELADLDPAGREAAQAAVRVRRLVKWVTAGGTLSLLSFAAGPEAGALVSALVGARVALLIRQPVQERRKRALIEAYVPLLNAYRELLVRYPVETLTEEVRDLVAMHLTRLAELMHRLGAPGTEDSPAQVVAEHAFRPDGFFSWKPRRVRKLFTDELCGSQAHVQVHHIRQLSNLRKGGRKPKPAWVAKMIARQRKTLVVCRRCHYAIHAGRLETPQTTA